jgi:hypothetical protein
MNKSAHKGRKAGQWPARRPERACSEVQFAWIPRCDAEIRLDSVFLAALTAVWRKSRPCSALP